MKTSTGWAFALALMVVGVLVAPASAFAMTVRQGDAVAVRAGETIDDDLYIFGSNVRVDGTVHGDVIAFAQSVTIAGKIDGDVMAGAQTVVVDADVGGSVRAAGSQVSVSKRVGGDVLAAGATVVVSGQVGRDVAAAGAGVTVGGVGRNAFLSGTNVTVDGSVGGDVTADGDTIVVANGARVGGRLTYKSTKQPRVDGQVVGLVKGEIVAQRGEPQQSLGARFVAGAIGWVRGLVGAALLALVVVLVFPLFSETAAGIALSRPWPALGVGVLVLIVPPAVVLPVFVLGLIIGGWWIAFLLLAVYWIGLAIGTVIGAVTLGRLLLRWLKRDAHVVWAALLGVLVIAVFGIVPILGGLVSLAALLFGLGAVTLAVWERVRPPKPAAEMSPPEPAVAVPPSV